MSRAFADAARRLANDEPRTTVALGAMLRTDGRRSQLRLLQIGPARRTVCPVVRAEPGVWAAFPVLGHEDDAPALAHSIDRSPAISVFGLSRDVDPLVPLLSRAVRHQSMTRFTCAWAPIDWRAPLGATRMASPLDLPALFDLYDEFELGLGRTRRSLRHELADAVHRFAVVVYEGDGRLDGAMIATTRTPRFLEWSTLTVRPELRGEGRAWALVDRAVRVSIATGLGFMAVLGPGNPMTLPADLGQTDTVTHVNLGLPNRAPGERRLRALWLRAARRRPRRPLRHLRVGEEPKSSDAGAARPSG